ncbi:FtsL-like putative cell division protein [Vicingaceae bacterium]|nr:FtsL-like putative cell division protein [Vicingaceae bacterium]MDB4060675.1 FtsL-like putative cell division protein [Vicingaceae bacterium]
MRFNKYKKEDKPDESPAEKGTTAGFKSLLTGSFLSKEIVLGALPYIFFLTFLGICYIANGYRTQKVVINLHRTNNSLKELRSEYITTKSDLMIISKQSEVAEATAEMGLKELTSPPKKIMLSKKEKKAILND